MCVCVCAHKQPKYRPEPLYFISVVNKLFIINVVWFKQEYSMGVEMTRSDNIAGAVSILVIKRYTEIVHLIKVV